MKSIEPLEIEFERRPIFNKEAENRKFNSELDEKKMEDRTKRHPALPQTVRSSSKQHDMYFNTE